MIADLHNSPWKGIISEIGIGLEFSNRLLMAPGASKTVLGVNCDYAGLDRPANMRAISLENVQRLAVLNYEKAISNPKIPDHNNIFGLAISGAHYSDRMSHAWIALKTCDFESHMHVNIEMTNMAGISISRGYVGSEIYDAISVFLEATLLKTKNWRSVINSGFQNYVDVLYAPGVSDVERLNLIDRFRPLVFHKGKFQRSISYLCEAKAIYSGSFNPIHDGHLEIGENCLFELSTLNCTKGYISFQDLLHRIKMIDLCGVPVIITADSPMFYHKDQVFRKLWTRPYSYRVGSDTWNRTIAAHQYSSVAFLGDCLKDSDFQIVTRPGNDINENAVSDCVKHSRFGTSLTDISSTAIRAGNMNGVPSNVLEYIKNNHLYENS